MYGYVRSLVARLLALARQRPLARGYVQGRNIIGRKKNNVAIILKICHLKGFYLDL